MRKKGKIKFWNKGKAFGFIQPDDGGKEVFVHISSFQIKKKSSDIKGEVSFILGKDKNGRDCALDVLSASERVPPTKKQGKIPFIFWIIPIYVVVLIVLFSISKLLFTVLAFHLAMSIVTFGVYAWDKSSAIKDRWRTPESTLHLLALCGGWPGAMLAQQVLRHKSKKQSFRFVFWGTVLLSISFVIYTKINNGMDIFKIGF